MDGRLAPRRLAASPTAAGSLLGDEGVTCRGEAVAVVEDVAAHLRQLLDAVGLQGAAQLIGGQRLSLGIEQLGIVGAASEPGGIGHHSSVEPGWRTGEHPVGQP